MVLKLQVVELRIDELVLTGLKYEIVPFNECLNTFDC